MPAAVWHTGNGGSINAESKYRLLHHSLNDLRFFDNILCGPGKTTQRLACNTPIMLPQRLSFFDRLPAKVCNIIATAARIGNQKIEFFILFPYFKKYNRQKTGIV